MVLGVKNCFLLNPLIIRGFAVLNVNNRAPGLLLPTGVGLKCSLLVVPLNVANCPDVWPVFASPKWPRIVATM